MLRGTERTDVERGQVVLAKPGFDHASHEVQGFEVYVLKKEEGGSATRPFFTGYRPQFYFRTTDVTGVGELFPRVRRW